MIGVESFVGNQGVGGHARQEGVGAVQIVGLPGRQEEVQRVAQSIDQSMDFGAQSSPRAPDCLVRAVFLSAPALC